MSNTSKWRSLAPESFTALIGGVSTAVLLLLTVTNKEPSATAWVFAAGCLGVGTVTTAVGSLQRRNGSAPPENGAP